MAKSGDSLFICVKQDDTILCIVAAKDATITSQLYWLFDITDNKAGKFTQNSLLNTDSGQLEFLARTILEQIGIAYEEDDSKGLLAELIGEFGNSFPKTTLFSSFARSLVKDVDPISEPDVALLKWFDMDEKLFFLWKKILLKSVCNRDLLKMAKLM